MRELERAREIGLGEGLRYVYTGNVAGHAAENTFCTGCGKEIISRQGFFVRGMAMRGSACSHCGSVVPGRFS